MTEAMKITLSTQPADGRWGEKATWSINNDGIALHLSLIHISEPTRLGMISYAVFCLKKKKMEKKKK